MAQNWASHNYPGGIDAPFNVAETFGPAPRAHDYLDQLRMAWRSTPEATIPDGYLGTVNSRRQDRLLDGLRERSTSKPYTRGVHKGERIDTRDYYWPPEFNLWSGLEREAAGVKFAPPGLGELLPDERYPTDRRVGPRSVPVGARYQNGGGPSVPQDPDRVPILLAQAPPWSISRAANPGMAIGYPGR